MTVHRDIHYGVRRHRVNCVKHRLVIITFLAGLFASADAWALRCGSKLVKEGMDEQRVIELCGEPAAVTDLGYVFRPYIVKVPAGDFGSRAVRRVYGGYHQELAVRELRFNFGPHRLMRVIRFEGGRVVSIKTAGYGYLKKD